MTARQVITHQRSIGLQLDVTPFLLAPRSGHHNKQDVVAPEERTIWALPYALVLRHTVEEVVGGCLQALQPTTAASTSKLRAEVVTELLQQKVNAREHDYGDMQMPRKLLLQEWIMEAKQKNAVVFIAGHILHLCTTQQGFKV
jgi:hypothetical protein